MVIKLISRAETENFRNHYLFIAAHSHSPGLWTIPFQIVEYIYYLSLATEEQAAGGKLVCPVGEPGSIEVSASLLSTFAGFLSGASPSLRILIFSDFCCCPQPSLFHPFTHSLNAHLCHYFILVYTWLT